MPDHKPESYRANRLLLGVAFSALVLLGPAFTLGYVSGYRSGRANPEITAPPQTVPQPATVKDLRKPGARVKKTTARADQPAERQVYLQLAATAEDDSALMLDVLRNKGFSAMAVEVPQKSGMRRVLIGPLN